MIFIDNQIPYLAAVLSESHDVFLFDGRTLLREQLMRFKASAIFVRSVTPINAELLNGTVIRFVGSATAGIDHVDVEYLKARNISFASASGSNANAVAEYVMDWIDELHVVHSATIGIVGFGHIGKLVARYARAYGMQVLVNDPPLQSQHFLFPHWCSVVPLTEIMKRSDVITLHVPLTVKGASPTQNMITTELLNLCSSGTLFINAARGGLIDERHLSDLVSTGTLRAVLDVFANEPNIDPYVVERIAHITPHIAGYSLQAKENAVSMVYEAYTGKPWVRPAIADIPATPTQLQLNHMNFEEVRRLTPLRDERRTPPTWEELDVVDS
ncbi:MAG: 4-phosphoerythronate dehydrogenase [Candidatus Kapabacteria bacterium]|nr:4-phosphoerythronate dehydrogenase [Candidatus Kapabacteria bacterium]